MPAPKLNNIRALEILEGAGYNNDEDWKLKIKNRRSYYYHYNSSSTEHFDKYYIPVDIWQKHTGKRFNIPFRKGMKVVLSHVDEKNAHWWSSNDFSHYGFGSGKKYDFQTNEYPYGQSRILKVRNSWTLNPKTASIKAKYLANKGYKVKVPWYADKYRTESPQRSHFEKQVRLKMHGVMHPKKMVNGWVKEVYVHFSTWWTLKREARIQVLFENGFQVLLKTCEIKKSFKSDYDYKDNAYQCSEFDHCKKSTDNCTHRLVHVKNIECTERCFENEKAKCKPCFDFSKLHELVHDDGNFKEDSGTS